MASTTDRVKFADFELDHRTGEVWRNGSRVVLPKQPFRILELLVERAGTLVTREELRRELWSEDTFVDFEHSLNAAVRRLRDALGDSAAAPAFIETIPQRGYRFIGKVGDSGIPASAPEPRRRSNWRVASVTVAVALSIVLAVIVERPVRSSPQHRSVNLTRLTSSPGLNTEPALSPDGSLLAFASDRAGSGDLDIYVQSVAGGEPLRLTSSAADESEPSFAPDGAHVVFSRRGSGLYVVGSLGGEPRLIVRTAWARGPKYSPDGRWIVYWTGFPESVAAAGPARGALGSILIVPSDGGSPREVATHLANARYPVWAPDGEHILFVGDEDADPKTHDWYVIATKGGSPTKTGAVDALRSAGVRAAFPIPGCWRARNNTVLFATTGADSSNVWQVAISPSTYRVSGPPERLTFGTAVERNPVVSSSGRVAFESVVENVDVWRVPLDQTTGVASGPLERITDDAASDRLRSVSADGRKVFFISSRTKNDEVWMKDLASGRERQLTYRGVDEASASPDGSRVAFSTNASGREVIEIVRTADGSVSKLCDDCAAPGGWSIDGRRLLYRTPSSSELLAYDFVSNRPAELVSHSPWSLDRPRFTPDGRWVTFHTANSPNVRQIYSARIRASGPVAQQSWVPIVTDHGCHPSWARNGSLLYYFSFRDGTFCPWVQQVDAATNRPIGAPRAVQHFDHPRLRAATGAAAFNDVEAGYLYMTLTETTGNIWMMESPE